MGKTRVFVFQFVLLVPLCTSAQETWGISNSNFAGNMGIFLNPSSIVLAPYKTDFNILSGDFFLDNNYAYRKKTSFAITKSITGETVGTEQFNDYYTPKPDKRAYVSSYIMGPSYIRNNRKTAWGVHLAIRNAASANDVPFHLAKFIYEGFNYTPQHGINYTAGPYKSAAMGWVEIGGTYARVLLKTKFDKHIVKAGVTLNFLAGSYGIYINSERSDYIVPVSHLLVVNNMTVQYGHSSPNDGDHIVSDLLKIRGLGASATVGFTYINSTNREAYECSAGADNLRKYKYRLGVSLIDFGYINYNDRVTRQLTLENVSTVWPGFDTTKFLNWFYIDTLISNRFYGDPFQSRTGKSFNIFLPSAASLQFDYNIWPKYYLNATIVQRVPVSEISVIRSSQVSLTPRYETRKFEIDVPLTFFEYTKPHLGVAIRYGVVVLGTDRLGTFLGLWDSTGFDFFFGIKINTCDKPFRKSKTGCPV